MPNKTLCFAVRLAKWTSNLRPNEARRRGFSIYQIEATAAIKEDWHPNLVFIVSFQLSHISGQVSGFFPTTTTYNIYLTISAHGRNWLLLLMNFFCMFLTTARNQNCHKTYFIWHICQMVYADPQK